MAFKPFNFTYTPPLTVPPPPPTSTASVPTGPTVVPTGTTSGTIAGAQSNAGILISQLNNLTVMSQYLQDVIVARTGKIAIEINPAVDPLTSRALSSIYGTDTPPNFVTVSMYDSILDAHFGAQQLEMSIGNDSVVQPNPMQVADLTTVVSTINTHLIASPSYNNWLPLQLASLKSDSIVFQSWATALGTYPAYYATQSLVPSTIQPPPIQAAGLDMSPDLYSYQSDAVVRFGQAYSNVYQALATVSAVERDIGSVMQEYFYQPLSSMLRIVSLLGALEGLAHKPNMSALQGDLINYSFARLASDTSSMLHTCDQLVSLGVSPLQGTLGSIGGIIAQVQQVASVAGTVGAGGLAGMSKANACASANPANISTAAGLSLTVPGLGIISEGLKQLGETLNWAQMEATKGLSLLDKSFRQLLERRLSNQNNQQSIMCSIRALDALIGLATGVVKELQKGTLTANSTPKQQQDATSSILTSLQTNTNTTFVSSGNQIIANPPDMPAVTPAVQSILSQAKIRTTIGTIQS